MIAAHIGERTLKIRFHHDYPRQLVKGGRMDRPIFAVGRDAWAHARTICEIIEGPRGNELVVSSGVSYCSILDNPNKELGRQIALGRAISIFDRDTQGALRHAYSSRSRTSGKPTNKPTFEQGDNY